MTEQTEQTGQTANAKPSKPRRSKPSKPLTANGMAARLSAKHGRVVTAKSVRQWARENLRAYMDEGYTPHAYNAADVRAIEAGFAARSSRSAAQTRKASK